MVRIMFGCDKFCTYCIVPRVRGPEQSRPAAEIVDEVRRLADEGCLEVTLLGQTVNSYQDATGPQTVRLADLLYQLHDIEGLRRLKFVTNYPKHMTDDLLQAVRDLPKVSPYLHVPAQSGSNAVLAADEAGLHGRGVPRDARPHPRRRSRTRPSPATSSSASAARRKRSSSRRSTWCARRGSRTASSSSTAPGRARRPPSCTPTTCRRRSSGGGTTSCWPCRTRSAWKTTSRYLGRTVEILVEGPSKVGRKRSARRRRRVQLVGRTMCDRIVVFDGPPELTGRILPVVIEKVDAFTLFGRQQAGLT